MSTTRTLILEVCKLRGESLVVDKATPSLEKTHAEMQQLLGLANDNPMPAFLTLNAIVGVLTDGSPFYAPPAAGRSALAAILSRDPTLAEKIRTLYRVIEVRSPASVTEENEP